ncbi:MAG TPA: winged helix-turn-helix domain-containing protein, partial [Caulobacter sp.]|nr:winged helix-turn-helix domain-containing protein [Caulobacter sp.]
MDLAAIAMFLLMEEASRRSVARLTGLWQRNDGSVEPGSFRFDRFQLDPGDRRLLLDGATVDLNARYLDALALMVREQGRLVSKERFHQEVWRGVPVTDEALTQCIRTLRRQLGDDAARPRFIETVPKHGYRFIARVVAIAPGAVMEAAAPKVR